jgi:hypothetical protein
MAVPFYVEAAGVPSFVMDGRLWTAIESRRQGRLDGAACPDRNPVADVSATEQQILDEHAEVVTASASLSEWERSALLTDASAAWAVRAFHALTAP